MSYVENKFVSNVSFATSTAKVVEESSSAKHVTLSHSTSSNSMDSCARCNQTIYPLELMGQIMGQKYHKQCFKCSVCDRNLDFKTYQTNLIDLSDKQIYCSSHSPKNGKGTIDFNAAENVPKTIALEFEKDNSIDNQAAEIVLTVINKSAEDFDKETIIPEEVIIPVQQTSTHSKSRSESIGADEVLWKEIYDTDEKQKTQAHHGSNGFLASQLSNDSTFYKRSQDNLNYLDFKAGSGHPRQHNLRKSRSPEAYRKPLYGPFDSAYRKDRFESVSKVSWKEIYESDDRQQQRTQSTTNDRSSSKNRLDLLDKNELSWREIYENDYTFSKKVASTHDLTVAEEAYEFDAKDFEPHTPVERVIDSIAVDSSLIKKIPSKEELDNGSSNGRKRSESYASTKETSTYHHQLSDNSSNRVVYINKAMDEQPTAEQKQKVLDELFKQSLEHKPRSPTQPRKEIIKAPIVPGLIPAIVNEHTDNKPVVIVTQKSVETKIMGENRNCGVIKLTVHYDELRHRLSITCHQAQNLKNVEKKGVSDPYCRIYLVPDDKKSYKRKTKVVKDNLNPKWEETFDYKLTYEQSVGKDLIVSLKDDKKGLFSKQETRMLGEVRVNLAENGVRKPYTRWYFLQPLGSVSKLLLNNGINPYKK